MIIVTPADEPGSFEFVTPETASHRQCVIYYGRRATAGNADTCAAVHAAGPTAGLPAHATAGMDKLYRAQ